MSYLLDTNVISYLVKKNARAKAKFWSLKVKEEDIYISIISYYEVKRGLLYANATRQMANFTKFCQEVKVLFLDDLEIIERAAAIHADLRGKGTLLEDADILIAATAIARDLTLVSHDSDMLRVPGLKLEDWL
ncbi:MAG: type II toxin-antitoxin system VapC family toxin, partial [Oscillatoria sp. SIO1A7]|nr:type II toxin-antitoxin system VapC family toxin [Oscillatoria sp. SIO1A7]